MAGAKPLAHERFQIFAEAGFDGCQVIAATAQQNAALWKRWVGFIEQSKNLVGRETDLVVDVCELCRNLQGVIGLALHGEEALRANG